MTAHRLIALLAMSLSVGARAEEAPKVPSAAAPSPMIAADASLLPVDEKLPGRILSLPQGAKLKSSFNSDRGQGADNLFDNDLSTSMRGAGNAAGKGPVSVLITFAEPIEYLGGIETGAADRFKNYYPIEMEFWGDSDGDGRCETRLGSTRNLGPGEDSIHRHRFDGRLEKTHALEIRAIEQSVKGSKRAFQLNEMRLVSDQTLPIIKSDPSRATRSPMNTRGRPPADGLGEMRYVVEDFESLSSWRTWSRNTAQPEGERPYGGYTYLTGAHRPQQSHRGVGVGLIRYCFKQPVTSDGINTLWAQRGSVTDHKGAIDAIRFWANPQGLKCSISVEIVDSAGKKARLPATELRGDQWAEHVIEVNEKTVPSLNDMQYPLSLLHIFFSTPAAGTGDVLIDDLTLVGSFDPGYRVSIEPAFGGMAYDPKQDVVVRYRLSNALPKAVSANFEAKLYSSFDTMKTSPVATQAAAVTIPPYGDMEVPVNFGRRTYGHYEASLSLNAEGVQARKTDMVAVLNLNGGRVNRSPMWFGSQHAIDWTSDEETRFLLRNVVAPLGLDAYRTFEPHPAVTENNLLIAAGFNGVPVELREPSQKSDNRGAPTDLQAYGRWVSQRAVAKYLPYADSILSVEFYNEPDLPNFCFLPDIQVYLEMHRKFAAAFRSAIPGVKIGTGGNTVLHGKAKSDFNSAMYTQLAVETDVAQWHAHGELSNYILRHRMVEGWLKAGGKEPAQWKLGNSEAGFACGPTAQGRLDQADNLVKKIGWAKSQSDSYFYCFFTTHDTFDPQTSESKNEFWGLVTSNKRLKPSGQAYNELIRKLANTTGEGEVELDSRFHACAYRRENGSSVWLVWPRERGVGYQVRFAASDALIVTDMFGASTTVTPRGGVVNFQTNGYPFYVEAQKGVAFGPAATPTFISFPAVAGAVPGNALHLPINVRNDFGRATPLTLTLETSTGAELAQASLELGDKASADVGLSWNVPADQTRGSIGARVRIQNPGGTLVDETLPITLFIAEQAVRADGFTIDGKPDAIPGAVPIVIDQARQIQDLIFDPGTPIWRGPDDLSVRATFAHDTKGLYLAFDVQDQTHIPGPADDKLWKSDSVQVAIVAGNAHTEIGLTETNGGFGWCWMSPDTGLVKLPLKAPVKVGRQGNHTVYETYLTFESLGIVYAPNTPLRATFLINEDDGRGRARIAKWFDGIAAGKSADLMGFLLLQ